jgi:CheY-like chemotaxis protein
MYKIFDPFFTTKEVGKGTGMGLAIVYSIVKQCGGFINVYSEPGFGTTFRIYFPKADCDITSEGKPKASNEKILTLFKKPNILFVDDEKEIGEGYLKLLLDKGFNVFYVSDPEEGINAVKNGKFVPELLVSDIVMPKINGIELENIIKQYVPNVKTIFISGYPDEIIKEKGIDTESMILIRKPFKLEDLISKIYEIYNIKGDSDDK